jgi:spore coat protein U-like protein
MAGLALTVTVTLARAAIAACTIDTTPVNFGNYDVFSSTATDSTGSVQYRCGNFDFNIQITLDKGGAPTFNPRRMLNGSQALNYNLYLNAARTIIWGDGTGGTQTYFNANPPRRLVTVTIYGRIPAGQDVRVGTYSNTVTATINF